MTPDQVLFRLLDKLDGGHVLNTKTAAGLTILYTGAGVLVLLILDLQ